MFFVFFLFGVSVFPFLFLLLFLFFVLFRLRFVSFQRQLLFGFLFYFVFFSFNPIFCNFLLYSSVEVFRSQQRAMRVNQKEEDTKKEVSTPLKNENACSITAGAAYIQSAENLRCIVLYHNGEWQAAYSCMPYICYIITFYILAVMGKHLL